jgi:2-polyprenyl-6-methoxyphenol hydroxylase-like FAD-dependent oxidoreductase
MNKVSSLRIAIVGGGPGGLTLARILHTHGICATVFEREPFPASRPQGGSLDMHADAGQLALAQADLTAEFLRFARYEDQEVHIYNKHGKLLFAETGNIHRERPEIDRGQLRQILRDSVPPESIRWNHALRSVEPAKHGFILVFQNDATETFDLVIGADGTWSRVRPLLSSAHPHYSGVTMVELGIEDADRRRPDLARLVGRGMMFAVGDRKIIGGHRDADAHLGVYAGLRVPEDWFASGAIDTSSTATVRTGLAAQFPGWSSVLLELLCASEERITPRPIYALPIGHQWEHRSGLTLIGDAAHVMSPFGGDGANLAMLDAADLASRLVHADDWKTAVAEFETGMFTRAASAAEGARDGINEVFSEAGLEHMLEQMRSHADAPSA